MLAIYLIFNFYCQSQLFRLVLKITKQRLPKMLFLWTLLFQVGWKEGTLSRIRDFINGKGIKQLEKYPLDFVTQQRYVNRIHLVFSSLNDILYSLCYLLYYFLSFFTLKVFISLMHFNLRTFSLRSLPNNEILFVIFVNRLNW